MEIDVLKIYYLTKIVGGYETYKGRNENIKLLTAYFKSVAKEAEKKYNIDYVLSFDYLKEWIENGKAQILYNLQQLLERQGLNIDKLSHEERIKHLENTDANSYTTRDTLYAEIDPISLTYQELEFIGLTITKAEHELIPQHDNIEKVSQGKQVSRNYVDDYFNQYTDKDILTNKDLETIFNINRVTIINWRKKGKLEKVSDDDKRPILYSKADIVNKVKDGVLPKRLNSIRSSD